ncbi:MAG TPA: hypothetical protein VFB51_00430 [Solirubrobacterales bacterium]|nr:hypothetical protein [Solirubrobacterales bacterium]
MSAARNVQAGPRDALAAADKLVAEGRCLDAVDLLTEANRRERDTAIEVRLVRLRNEAYAELDRSPTESPWPDEGPRPLDGGEALPAIDRGEITPAAVRDSILRYGCAFVPGLVAQEDVDMLVAGIDHAFEGCDAQAERGWSRETAGDDPEADSATLPWYYRFEGAGDLTIKGETRKFVREGAGVWTVESPRMMFQFLEVLERTGLRGLIGDYLGERPALTLKKSTLRRTPPLPYADWHQDGAFLGEGIRTINLWLSLSHCGDDAPGLDLVPRRLDRIVETGSGGAIFPWSVGPGTVEEAREDVPVLRPRFKPGDALLFDEMFLHRTATDETMTRERYAIESWFFAPSVYPGDQIPFVW